MHNVPNSLLELIFTSVGPQYSIILPLTAILSFILTLVLVLRGHGPMAAASLFFIVHVPMLVGAFAGMQSMVVTYFTIVSGGGTPDPLMLTQTISSAFVTPFYGILLMLPAYAVATIGTFARSFSPNATGNEKTPT